METNWLKDLIVEGLQGLMALRLDGAPSVDTLPATVSVWYSALKSRPIVWDQGQDTDRIRDAMRHLAATCERWPAPATFLHALPARPVLTALNAPTGNSMPPEIRTQIADLVAKMKRKSTAKAGQ